MKRLFYTLHWLNLDTALGAVVTSGFIARSMNVEVSFIAYITLFLAVLTIYNFDHLVDARRISSKAVSMRRLFYQVNIKALSIYQLALILFLIIIVWYLPVIILRAGIVLGMITSIYFILLFLVFPKQFLLKEFMISIVYSIALFLGPIYSIVPIHFGNEALLLWVELLLLAFTNTLIFAWYDYAIDLEQGQTSLANRFGRDNIYKVIIVVLSILAMIVLYTLIEYSNIKEQIIISFMAVVLIYLLRSKKHLAINDRYRIVGDAVFVLPVIVYIF